MFTAMFDWNDLTYFLQMSRLGRLADAAQRLKVDQTTVSRRIAALESSLGTRLFEKSPRGHVLTEAGRRLLVHAEKIEASSISLYQDLSGGDAELTGAVRLATPEAFGAHFLVPLLPEFHASHPKIELELVSETRRTSLSKREADLAVTLGRPDSGRLVGQKLTTYRLQLYAAPAYLASHPPIATIADLREQSFVSYIDDLLTLPELRVLPTLVRDPNIVFRSTSIAAQQRAAMAGMGIALLQCFSVAPHHSLVPVLPQQVAVEREYWLLVHEDFRQIARVDAVCRFLTDVTRKHAKRFIGPATRQSDR